MKQLFILLAFFFVLAASAQSRKLKVAHIENGVYKFDIDTTAIKELWVTKAGIADVKYQKIEILKRQTFGEMKEDFYMLIAYDKTKNIKTCRYIIRKMGSFYFGLFTKAMSETEIFYNTVFTCRGEDKVCFPEVCYMNKQYFWGGNQKLECSLDNSCAGTRSVEFPSE